MNFKSLDIIGRLIAINIVAWVITQLLRLFTWLFTGNDCLWEPWFALHADLDVFLHTPWTILTYMFVHANLGTNIFHIVFNMLWLYWFGQFYLRLHTGRQLLGTYLLGGLVAGLFVILCLNSFPHLATGGYLNVPLVGASGAIFALVGAVATRQPDDALYLNFFVKVIPVKLKWFAIGALVINLMNLAGGDNVGGIICHIGGLGFGALCGWGERRGVDLTRHFNLMCDNIAVFFSKHVMSLFKPRPKMKASRGGASNIGNDRQKDHDYNQRRREDQARIDAILDKISRSGYDALSAEEKATLFDASRRRKS